jgi:ketosteroid isomerase-like protein
VREEDVVPTLARASCAALLALAAWAGPARALDPNTPLPPGVEGELLKADALRLEALVAADVPALQALLGDELRYVHADGRVETKYVLIAAVESQGTDYVAAKARDVVARAYGEAGVVSGSVQVRVRSAGGPERKLRTLYTAVYAKRNGAWQLVAYQSTRAPDDS